MARVTLTDFCKTNGYNAVSKVRMNSNNYPFVTLVNKADAGNAFNVYCSKDYATQVKQDDVVDIKTLFVVEAANAEGELRFKLTNNTGTISDAKLADYQDIN